MARSNGEKRDYRAFASPGKGGLGINPGTTACLFIEFQNEFASEGGKLHGQVREVMALTGMLQKASQLARDMRSEGVKIFHAPITFAADGSDNPNRHLGILAGCDTDDLFTRGTWNAEICKPMRPEAEDIVVVGKRGLSAFPNTDLEEKLRAHNVETVALGGFMANCCVESTMRDACEKGFNVITLTDCVATTTMAGYKSATEITYPFFSTPMNAASFTKNVKDATALPMLSDGAFCKRARRAEPQPMGAWAVRSVAPDVYHVGPWFVDVRHCAIGERVILRSGEHELRRYLTFGEASGLSRELLCSCIYRNKMGSSEPFGWLCNMAVVRLPGGGCLVYSPVLDAEGVMDGVVRALEEHNLLPVRFVVAPSPQHHLALGEYQRVFPDAFYICGAASAQMPPLTRKRREIRFDGVIAAGAAGAVLVAPEGAAAGEAGRAAAWEVLQSAFQICVMDDSRTGEVVLNHRASKTFIISDLLYKSNPAVVGPGGPEKQYSRPEWFAEGQEELFYSRPDDNSGGLLPAYRTHPRLRSINIPGMKRSLGEVLSWSFDRCLACHTDPIEGDEAKRLLRTAWAWALE